MARMQWLGWYHFPWAATVMERLQSKSRSKLIRCQIWDAILPYSGSWRRMYSSHLARQSVHSEVALVWSSPWGMGLSWVLEAPGKSGIQLPNEQIENTYHIIWIQHSSTIEERVHLIWKRRAMEVLVEYATIRNRFSRRAEKKIVCLRMDHIWWGNVRGST